MALSPDFQLALHFEDRDAVAIFDELDDQSILEFDEFREFDHAPPARAAMTPLHRAAAGEPSAVDENVGERVVELLEIDIDAAHDIDHGFDAHVPAGVGNARPVANEFANDVRRIIFASKLAARHHKLFPRTTLSGRFRRAVYGLLGGHPLRDIELWDTEPGLEPQHTDNSGALLKPPDRILVVVTLRIGDVLLSTPVIRSLRLAWPQAKIDVLVFEHTEGILLRNPDIECVITVPARPGFWRHMRLMFSLLRRYDLALTTLLGDRPTLYTWMAGKTRLGMQDGSKKEHWKQYLLTHWAKFEHVDCHTVLTNLGLVDLLGIKRSHEVVVAWNRSDENSVGEALPFEIGAEAYAVLHMSPKFTYKMWQRDGWIELAEWLADRGIRSVLTGSSDPAELSYVELIYRSMPSNTVNIAGKLSLAENAFLISSAKYYIGPDTALTHMAAALGTPTVALFGPSNPVKWGPWPKGYEQFCNPYRRKGTQHVNNVVLVQGEGDCVPCMEEGCDRHNASLSDCLQKLPAARVIAAIQELSGETKHIMLAAGA